VTTYLTNTSLALTRSTRTWYCTFWVTPHFVSKSGDQEIEGGILFSSMHVRNAFPDTISPPTQKIPYSRYFFELQ
jgi:hypothetical protein